MLNQKYNTLRYLALTGLGSRIVSNFLFSLQRWQRLEKSGIAKNAVSSN